MMDLTVILRATIVLGAALLVARLCGRARASLRHVILAAAFGILVALPVTWPMPTAIELPLAPSPTNHAALGAPVPVETAPPTTSTAGKILLAVWMAGMAVTLVPLIVAIGQLRTLRHAAVPWPEGREILEELTTDTLAASAIDVLTSASAAGPLTCGLLRPAIVVPLELTRWPRDSVRRALVHELEHIRRRDWLTSMVARLVCTFYWFQPLVWVARRRLVLEAERACDDAVIAGGDALGYAALLVTVAEAAATTTTRQHVVAMARRGDLARRVDAILDSTQVRGCAGRPSLAVATSAALAVLLAVSSLQVTASSTGAGSTIDVSIADPFGGVAANIPVLLDNAPAKPRFSVEGFTDDRGRFSLRVPAGTYLLTAPIDFFPETMLTVGANDAVERAIRMEIRPVTSAFSVCVDCAVQPQPAGSPDDASPSGPAHDFVSGAAPEGGWPSYQSRIQHLTARMDGPKPSGTVVVEGRVAANGTVRAVRVISGDHPTLATAAIASMRETRWRPAHVRGVAVEAPLQITVEYTRDGDR
jgi:beta-lactamase regulating signal transducer with metallopeptidase domain